MQRHITDDIKIVYFNIGFFSTFESKNLIKIPIEEKNHILFHFYKAELSLKIMEMFPDETDFIFTDTDVLFSKRIDFKTLVHTHPYPLGVFGPHEYPFFWEATDTTQIIFDETKLMEYYNVSKRSVRYQWSCFYVYNRECIDFLDEYTSMCNNQYLLKYRKTYLPFHDETPFNICLWKRNAQHSLGFAMVNTHNPETVKLVEEKHIQDTRTGNNFDELGADWEYIHDSNQVLMYHGFKDILLGKQALKYLE